MDDDPGMTLNAAMGAGVMYWDDYGIRTTKVPIDLSSGTQVKIRVITLPVLAGDLLKVSGMVNLTNDADRANGGYAVGIATQLWLYDASTPPEENRPATYRLLTQRGDNITPQGHHAGMPVFTSYVVPATWVPGRSAGITLSVDAHSTGEPPGNNDHIKVETYGCLIVERYRAT